MQRLTAITTLALAIHTVGAQDARQRPPQDRFRAGIELVEVDVIVTDRLGEPVRGLTAEDFEIHEDGEPVEIAAFDAIELPDPQPEDRSATAAPASGAVIHNNLRALEGGIYVILLDFSTSPGVFDRARKAALALIDELGPTDQVAMMSTGGQEEYQVEFTTDRGRLTRALARLVVRGQTLEDLPDLIGRIATQLEPLPARRKVVALISEGFHFDPSRPEYLLAFDAAHRANLAVSEVCRIARRNDRGRVCGRLDRCEDEGS